MSERISTYLLFPVLKHAGGYQEICWYAGGTTGTAVEYLIHASLDLCYAVKAHRRFSTPFPTQIRKQRSALTF